MNGFKTNSLGEIEECSEKPSLQDNGNIYTATISEFLTGKKLLFFLCFYSNQNEFAYIEISIVTVKWQKFLKNFLFYWLCHGI